MRTRLSVREKNNFQSREFEPRIKRLLEYSFTLVTISTCTNQMDGAWNCVEITERTTDHFNKIKDTLEKLVDLKSQWHDAINNFGR